MLHATKVLEAEDAKTNVIFKKGQFVFQEGGNPVGIYFINSGKIKISHAGTEGKDQIVRLAKEGDILGYRALLSNERYNSSAIALEHIRPPIDRPPMTICEVETPSDSAKARTCSFTLAISTGVLSGNDFPASRYGKSCLTTGNGDSASCIATNEECVDDEPAPGNNTTPAMEVTTTQATRDALQ